MIMIGIIWGRKLLVAVFVWLIVGWSGHSQELTPSYSFASSAAAAAAAVGEGGDGGVIGTDATRPTPDTRRIFVATVATACASDCLCTAIPYKGLQLRCQIRDSLTAFPVIKNETISEKIHEIVIVDQPRLTELNATNLMYYPSLETLTINYSGLKRISIDAFKSNRHLRIISLKSNQLKALPWSTIIDNRIINQSKNRIVELNIEDNPLSCVCDSRWLRDPHAIFSSLNLLSPRNCNDDVGLRMLQDFEWSNCDVPKVGISAKRIEVNPSRKVELVCTGEGIPRPSVYWKFLRQWPPDSYRLQTSDDNLTVTLTIPSALPQHSGNAWCVSENAAGRSNQPTLIVVLSAPKILELKEVINEFDQCIPYTISGLPAPNVTWYRDSVKLELNEIIYEEDDVREGYISRKGCLMFAIQNHLNNGNYTLVAENEYGTDTRSVSAVFMKTPDLFRHGPFLSFEEVDQTGFRHRNESFRESQDYDEDSVRNNIAILVAALAVLGGLLVVIVVVVVCFLAYCQKKRKSSVQKVRCFRFLCPDRTHRSVFCDTIAREMIPLNSAQIVDNPNYFKQDSTHFVTDKVSIPHISRQNINILRDLGEGAFGKVVLGSCRLTEPTGDRLTLVAIKTLKENLAEDAKRDFDREAELLTSLQHENIVRLYGISEDGETRMIIFEYMENGDLNNFLRCHSPDARFIISRDASSHGPRSPLRLRELLHISRQIASGGEYLAKNRFIHRDMATRNCLVGEKLTVKIGDFGMSRDVYSADYYKVGGQTMLPIRWMPYESILYRTFTMESDVWSFGVVLWEIFSYGKQPWYELSNHEVIQHLEMGKVLDCPLGTSCPEEVYRLMLGCWRKHPEDRLTMRLLHAHLTRLLHDFDNELTDGSQDRPPKHVSYLEIVPDDIA